MIFSSPPEAVAAPNWLEKMFSAPQHKVQKQRKKTRKTKKATTGNQIRLPATAPVPEFADRNLLHAEAPIPEELPVSQEKPSVNASDEDRPARVQTPSGEPLDVVPDEPPKPEARPDDPPDAQEAIEPPKPEFRPDRPDPQTLEAEKGDKPQEPLPPPDPRSAVMADPSGRLPDEELACRRRLTELGVKFKEAKSQSDPSGCSMPYPIVLQSLGGNFDITPDAEMNCATAEATATFARDVISPTAKTVFDTTLESISHASAYVCRPRNGTQKLSEHAFGNALDIAGFTLSNGTSIPVELDPPEKNGRFLDKVREEACGPFKTVLGPGSNADHAEHLHFDLAPRRHGGTVCE
ncbi:MAG: extensin family protein [Rhizobiaceae bacterium]|nr:extensin family protein [Rhizobiaceae bacterium]